MRCYLKAMKIFLISFMILFAIFLTACGGGGDGGGGNTTPVITEASEWCVENIDLSFWTKKGNSPNATAFRNFWVYTSDPDGIDDITYVKVTNPEGTYWTLRDSSTGKDHYDPEGGFFGGWRRHYSSSHPNIVYLGQYSVLVRDSADNEVTDTISVNRPGSDSGSGFIYSENYTGPTDGGVEMLKRASVTNFTKEGNTITIDFQVDDARVYNGYVWFYDDIAEYITWSDFFKNTINSGAGLYNDGTTNTLQIQSSDLDLGSYTWDDIKGFHIVLTDRAQYSPEEEYRDHRSISSYWASGFLDPTFGTNGIVLYDYSNEEGRAVAIQPDGKIVIAGFTNPDVLVLRYNTDGTLDNTFGTDGVVTYDGGNFDEAHAIAIQADGKIVVVGYSYIFTDYELENVLILRLNTDGTLDNSFGTNGVVTTDVESYDYGYALALQSDGKIVVVGEADTTNDKYALLLRYNGDGTLDTSFGTNGVVKYDGIGWDIAYGVAIQSDNKILLTGNTSAAYPSVVFTDVLLLRYNSDGSLDNTFGTNGVFTYDSIYETGKMVATQTDGKILVGGSIHDYYNCDNNAALILRLTDDGSLDNTFGTNGVVTYNRDRCDTIYVPSFALQSDGKIVVVGHLNSHVLVLKYNSNGTLDTSFSGDGVGMYSSGGIASGYGVALQTDGKIVVTGNSSFHDGYSDNAVLTIRIIGQ